MGRLGRIGRHIASLVKWTEHLEDVITQPPMSIERIFYGPSDGIRVDVKQITLNQSITRAYSNHMSTLSIFC